MPVSHFNLIIQNVDFYIILKSFYSKENLITQPPLCFCLSMWFSSCVHHNPPTVELPATATSSSSSLPPPFAPLFWSFSSPLYHGNYQRTVCWYNSINQTCSSSVMDQHGSGTQYVEPWSKLYWMGQRDSLFDPGQQVWWKSSLSRPHNIWLWTMEGIFMF